MSVNKKLDKSIKPKPPIAPPNNNKIPTTSEEQIVPKIKQEDNSIEEAVMIAAILGII